MADKLYPKRYFIYVCEICKAIVKTAYPAAPVCCEKLMKLQEK